MRKTIHNVEHLKGLIDAFVYLYDLHENSINEEYYLGFDIKKIESTYNVIFSWQGKQFLVSPATELEPAEHENEQHEDSFMILEDESISKLEQFVSDVLSNVIQTEL
jgi:hypothetical protein